MTRKRYDWTTEKGRAELRADALALLERRVPKGRAEVCEGLGLDPRDERASVAVYVQLRGLREAGLAVAHGEKRGRKYTRAGKAVAT